VKSAPIADKTIAKPEVTVPSQLVLTKTIVLNTGTELVSSPQCDAGGNIYIADSDRLSISKLNPKGELVATFKATSSADIPQLDVAGMFTVSGDGDVRQLVFPHSFDRDVFLYNKDGSYKSFVKLDAGSIVEAFPVCNLPIWQFPGNWAKVGPRRARVLPIYWHLFVRWNLIEGSTS
jgi:outer membrane protein assembly factor BamB